MALGRIDPFIVLSAALCAACSASEDGQGSTTPDYPRDAELGMNMLQLKATHNSYHVEPEGTTLSPWQYTHLPLDEQLATQGVRGVELDTFYDELQDVFQVYHLPGVDAVTTCLLFTDCLGRLRSWSDAHPQHHPLFVQIEPKSEFSAVNAEAHFTRFEADILAVWPRERIVTPDDVRGDAATLRDAVTTQGWPALGEVRGKVLFFWDNTGELRDAYTRGKQNLDGRLIFAPGEASDPFTAIRVMNDPSDGIEAMVSQGFIVRTRADADGIEPRAGDTTRRERALNSGAQIVSTDFPEPVAGIDYSVEIPGGTPSRCNPLTAPSDCTPHDIENPALIE